MKVRQIGGHRAPSMSFGWLRSLGRGLGTLLRWFWLPGAIVAAVLTWGSPNVLWEYTYVPAGKARVQTTCTYLGLDGHRVAPATRRGKCPVVALFPLDLPDFSHLWRP